MIRLGEKWLGAVAAMVVLVATQIPGSAVEISEGTYEGRPQFIIRTKTATWYYDRAGGGFSRLLDQDDRDWIAFSKEPLNQFPASAAAGYRGMPNAVFVGPDKGAGHPGFDLCTSERTGETQIRTRSVSGKWQWSWTITESTANFRMEKADPEHSWWFLYEGPIAGHFTPAEQYWGTSAGGPHREVPDLRNQRFGQWQWAYFGDSSVSRVLFVGQHDLDPHDDTIWYLGSSEAGAGTAPDGMVVAGFGRGAGTKPLLRGSGQRFTVGFLDLKITSQAEHAKAAEKISEIIQPEQK